MKAPRAAEDGTVLRVCVIEKRDGGYYHLEGYVVTERDGTIRNVGSLADRYTGGLELDGLTAYSQGSDEDRERSAQDRHLYCWEIQYEGRGRLRLADLTPMLPTLKAVEKKMAKVAVAHGRPATFGQFLGRFALAVGAVGFVVRRGKRGGWTYDDSDYRLMSIGDGIEHADYMVRQWAREGLDGAARAEGAA